MLISTRVLCNALQFKKVMKISILPSKATGHTMGCPKGIESHPALFQGFLGILFA
jgi:hypothetical protein